MAINAYVGIPGSGKTYEVVKSVILPAFMKGRRIVTNIVGIDVEKMTDYVRKKQGSKHFSFENLGEIIAVEDGDILKPNFFPYKGSNNDDTIAKTGDLICIDEVWRVFDENSKILEEHRSFLAEHRHFVNDKGETCDLVVINQAVNNIPRFIKDRIETTYRMSKLVALGLRSRYRVDIHTGAKIFKSTLVNSIQCKYDSDIFPLYQSYDGNNAKEQDIDSRNNFFKSSSFLLRIVMLPILLGVAVYFLSGFLSSDSDKSTEIENSEVKERTIAPIQQNSSLNSPKISERQFVRDDYKLSSEWKISGYIKNKDKDIVILSNGKDMRYENAKKFRKEGGFMYGIIDGEKVTIYSGRQSSVSSTTSTGGVKWN